MTDFKKEKLLNASSWTAFHPAVKIKDAPNVSTIETLQRLEALMRAKLNWNEIPAWVETAVKFRTISAAQIVPIAALLLLALASGQIADAETARTVSKQTDKSLPTSTTGKAAADVTKNYYVGYTVVSNEYVYKDQKANYKIAVWYPSALNAGTHVYKLGPSSVNADLAVDSPVADGKFPIVFYSHGATGSGTSSFFICELLAKNGYIVVAPDYLDTVNAARIDEPVPFDGFMRMKTNRDIYWLREYGLNKASREGRTAFEYRPEQLKSTIELALAWNKADGNRFLNKIDADRVGLFGHSFGAWTSLLLCGADAKRLDKRIKAVVALSGPVNEFVYKVDSDNDLKAINVPVLFEYGDQEPALGRRDDKALLFEPANAPKMLLSIKNADHLSFSGGIKGEHKSSTEYLNDDVPRKTISETTLDFFDGFLKSNESKLERLKARTEGISSSAAQF